MGLPVICGYVPPNYPRWLCTLECGHWGWHRPQKVRLVWDAKTGASRLELWPDHDK